jgi:tRNA threonylcarbamoyladenosine biosynthesis protein TsaE
MEIITNGAKETQQVARKIIKDLILTNKKRVGALVVALSGDLGAGKTTFTQGLSHALGVKEKILSPTFVILKHFNILAFKHFSNLYHMDCYRLAGVDDLKELGLEEILKDPANLVLIEWAERIKDALPKYTVWIKFEHLGEDRRKIKIQMTNDK